MARQMKTCVACGEVKPLSAFHRDYRAADGRRSRCRECRRHGAPEPATPPVTWDDDTLLQHLLIGPVSPFDDVDDQPEEIPEDVLRATWESHRTEILATWTGWSPPWGWSKFESGAFYCLPCREGDHESGHIRAINHVARPGHQLRCDCGCPEVVTIKGCTADGCDKAVFPTSDATGLYRRVVQGHFCLRHKVGAAA